MTCTHISASLAKCVCGIMGIVHQHATTSTCGRLQRTCGHKRLPRLINKCYNIPFLNRPSQEDSSTEVPIRKINGNYKNLNIKHHFYELSNTNSLHINKNPTRCNSRQSDLLYCKVTLHVSRVTAPIIRSTKNCIRSLRYRHPKHVE